MKEFDYIILGGGLSGLSLAYELNRQGCLKNKTLAILEKRKNYKRDKNWSYWDYDHNAFKNCVIQSWDSFEIKHDNKSIVLSCNKTPYRTIDSKKFYDFIIKDLSKNKNILLKKDTNIISLKKNVIKTNKGIYKGKYIFDSLLKIPQKQVEMYQHFYGCEIEVKKNTFNSKSLQLMDFDCEQKNGLHFFYVLPFSKKRALIETTWYSKTIKKPVDYQNEISEYLQKYQIKGKIRYKEFGAIPLCNFPKDPKISNYFKIGTAGNMTRISTGYTFQTIQMFSKNLAKELRQTNKISTIKTRSYKYTFLDQILLSVIQRQYKLMPKIFFNLFKNNSSETVINFLSDKSNFADDIQIIKSMPKLVFLQNFLIFLYKQIFIKK